MGEGKRGGMSSQTQKGNGCGGIQIIKGEGDGRKMKAWRERMGNVMDKCELIKEGEGRKVGLNARTVKGIEAVMKGEERGGE